MCVLYYPMFSYNYSKFNYKLQSRLHAITIRTSCAGCRHNMPRPCHLDLQPFDLESGVRVTCDVSYLCANFGLPRPLCSRVIPGVHDRLTDVRRQTDVRQTDVKQHHRLLPCLVGGHNKFKYTYGRKTDTFKDSERSKVRRSDHNEIDSN